MRGSVLLIFSSLLCLISSIASAQRVHYLPDKVGVWKPFQMSCSGSGQGLTGEQEVAHQDGQDGGAGQFRRWPRGLGVFSGWSDLVGDRDAVVAG